MHVCMKAHRYVHLSPSGSGLVMGAPKRGGLTPTGPPVQLPSGILNSGHVHVPPDYAVRMEGNENTSPAWLPFINWHCMCPNQTSLGEVGFFVAQALVPLSRSNFSSALEPKIPHTLNSDLRRVGPSRGMKQLWVWFSHKLQHLQFGILENRNAGSFLMLKLVTKSSKFAPCW